MPCYHLRGAAWGVEAMALLLTVHQWCHLAGAATLLPYSYSCFLIYGVATLLLFSRSCFLIYGERKEGTQAGYLYIFQHCTKPSIESTNGNA